MNHRPFVAIGILWIFASACASPTSESPRRGDSPGRQLDADYMPTIEPFKIEKNRIYYTRVNFWSEFGNHSTTNYNRKTLIPVNTKVRLRLMPLDGQTPARNPVTDMIVLLVDDFRSLSVRNVRHHSKVSINEFVYRTFSREPIDLSVFDVPTRAAIEAGTPRAGMTKYQVLLARGYPPGHRTPSLTADTWHYWSSRYSSHAITFSDGRLLAGK